jgi:hypothetical protein
VYHGPASGDLFHDGDREVVIGDYDGYLYCLRVSNGELVWKDSVSHLLPYRYIGSPVTLADLDNDGYLDVIYMDGYMVRVVNRFDSTLWTYYPPGDYTNFRGCVATDVNNDGIEDITFSTNYGNLVSLDGLTGSVIRSFNLMSYAYSVLGDTSSIFEVDNAPIVADIDHDDSLELFIIAGKGRSDSSSWNDYGYAFCLSWGYSASSPGWTMFRHDDERTGCVCDSNGLPMKLDVAPALKNFSMTVFPNPATASFKVAVELPVQEVVVWELRDILGRLRFSQSLQMGKGSTTVAEFNREALKELPNGTYLLSCIAQQGTIWARVTLETVH